MRLARSASVATEAILWLMACLSPWALGSRGALAQLVLSIGVLLLALLRAVAGWYSGDGKAILNVPSLALIGLTGLALVQATPMTEAALRRLSPSAAALRASLIPHEPERVAGDVDDPVPLPPPTLSQYPEATVLMAGRLAALWIVFQSVMGLRRDSGAFRRFAFAIVVNSVLLALFSLVQKVTGNSRIFWVYPSFWGSNAGPYFNHNTLAATLNIGLGLSLGFILSPRSANVLSPTKGSPLPFLFYVLAVIAAGVMTSLSRVGFLAMTVTATVAWCTTIRRRKLWIPLAGVMTTVLLLGVFIAAAGEAIHIRERLATILESRSYQFRFVLWRDVVRAFLAHPLWGTGLGSFPVAAEPWLRHDTGGEIYNHAENDYLEWLIEGGILGFFLILAIPLGTAWLARAVLRTSHPDGERALVVGAVLCGISLMVHSLSDFALHTPPVALTAVILLAFVCKAGMESRDLAPPEASRLCPLRSVLAALILSAVSLAIVVLHYGKARAELELAPVHLTEIDRLGTSAQPAVGTEPRDEDIVRALDAALQYRPDWAEGHVRLAAMLVKLYEKATADAIGDRVPSPRLKALYSSPLWFHRRYHATPPENRETVAVLLAYQPIADYLVPATLEFLEARRSCPVLALPHAGLGSQDYLLLKGDPEEVYLERAYRQAGARIPTLELVAQLATQSGDLGLAEKCWKTMILKSRSQWLTYAQVAGSLLPPDEVLERVVPNGRYAILFAEHLYSESEDSEVRQRFFREALRRLPSEEGLDPDERLELEARACQGIGELDRAGERFTQALAIDPRRSDWRKELVDLLIRRGRLDEAHDQALVGIHFTPDDPLAQETLKRARDARARGEGSPGHARPTGSP